MNQARSGSSEAVDTDLDWRIVTAVADAKGVGPLELNERLHDVVDLDAVKRLFVGMPDQQSLVQGYVSFTFDGYEVVVTDEWEVEVVPQGNVAAD